MTAGRSPRARALAHTGVIAAVIFAAVPARADGDSPAAAQLFKEGRAAIAAGKVDEACAKFEQSFAIEPALGTRLNLADCFERRGRLVAAYQLFAAAAAEAARTSKAGRAQFARDRADALLARLVRVQIVVAEPVPGLTVQLAGAVLAPEAWAAVQIVEPGAIAVAATAPGRVAFRSTADARPGDATTIEIPALAIAEAPAVPAPNAAAAAASTRERAPRRTAAYVVGGTGAALLVGSLALGLVAKSTFDDAACGERAGLPAGVCTPEGQTRTDRARRLADVGTGLAVAGAVAVGVGVYLYVRAGHRTPAREAAVVLPAVTPDAALVVLAVRR